MKKNVTLTIFSLFLIALSSCKKDAPKVAEQEGLMEFQAAQPLSSTGVKPLTVVTLAGKWNTDGYRDGPGRLYKRKILIIHAKRDFQIMLRSGIFIGGCRTCLVSPKINIYYRRISHEVADTCFGFWCQMIFSNGANRFVTHPALGNSADIALKIRCTFFFIVQK